MIPVPLNYIPFSRLLSAVRLTLCRIWAILCWSWDYTSLSLALSSLHVPGVSSSLLIAALLKSPIVPALGFVTEV
ncbi:hypothetical protein M758_8G192500 [Ceratodon purpureus]|uniref:Uncharacterized protein n=1 Tax=Ceratodon purpureus TaxID=3225 RepID=A0A8T0H2W8_CERPU|nr:hypothetical protein KC19_8G197600 [Ceratodon purpureus]KAG0609542.1 hypothetical protein M758_8G192500 [Ceratodon purpureus]